MKYVMFPMTFEKKQLALIAIEGNLNPDTLFTPNLTYLRVSPQRHILLFGTHTRRENDQEEALSLTLRLRSPSRKIFVSTETVLFQNDAPKQSWLDAWNKTFDQLLPNEIAVSLELVRIYQRVFDIQTQKRKQQTIFLLSSKKINPSRLRGIQKSYSPLIGRKKEFNNLMEIIEQSFEDQGQIASIIGEAGLGKTRLKFELTQTLAEKDIRFYEGFFSLNSEMRFRGFHQLVQQILEYNTETFSKWNLNDSESAFLRYFLHPEETNTIVKDLNETELTQGVFHSIQKLLQNLGQQPLVLILDDFHWADERSEQLMDFLAQSMEKTKIAFFLFHRPTYVPAFKKRLNYHQVKLVPLQQEETRDFVKNVLKLDYIADRALQTLTDLSLGNPLYVEEILRELITQKKLYIDKEQELIRLIQIHFPQGSIPPNIQALIVSRLDLLPKDTKEILQWACAFGFRENHGDFELFLQTLGHTPESFQPLFEQGYLEEASLFPEHKYKFHHDLLYETIRQSIPESDWSQKSQRVAEFLHELYRNDFINQGDRIAEFYIKGTMGEKSFTPIFEAAKIALEQRRYSPAMKYFDHCYNLIQKNNITIDTGDFFGPYIETIFASGMKDKIQNTISVWETYGFSSTESETRFYKLYLEFLFTFREMEKLPKIAMQAIEKFKDSEFQDSLLIFEVRYFQALVYLFKFKDASHLAFKLLRKMNGRSSEVDDLKIDIYYGLGFITQQSGFPNIGSYLALIANSIADKTGNIKQKVTIGKRIAYLAVAQGYYKEAARVWSDLIYTSEQNGYMRDITVFKTNRILSNYFIGEYQKAINESESISHLDEMDWHKKWTINWLGQTFLASGAFSKVRELIISQRHFPTRDPYIRGNFLYLTANYHFQHGEYKKAESYYRYAKNLYQKNDQKIYALQMQLFELRCKLLQNKITPENATSEFDEIISNELMRKYFYEWNTQVLSYFFARHGCKTRFQPSEDFDPMNCNATYLRLQMFVEKIKWLEYIGKKEKAKKTKEQYLKHRQEMAFYVPDEYKKSYLEHPFYQV